MFTPFAFVKQAASAAPSFTGILDTYPSASFAYSVRKLSSTYSGYCMQVKRSSDSSTLDVGFDANNNLDTASITSFVGGGDGWVNIWYDQSGNSKNVTPQSGATQGFYIVQSGTLKTLNSKPAPYTPDGYAYGLGNGSISVTSNNVMWFDVSGCDDDTSALNKYGRILSIKNSGDAEDYNNCNAIINFYSAQNPFSSNVIPYQNNGYTTTGRSYTKDTQNLNFNYKDSNNIGGSTNGGSTTSSTTGCGSTALNSNIMRLGNDFKNGDSSLTGWIQEMIFWPAYTSGNVSGIKSNINTYYATY